MRHVRLNGSTIGRTDKDSTGMNISISGWAKRLRGVKVGEILEIVSSITKDEYSSYKVTSVSYPHNVNDQFFIDMRWISKKELQATRKHN